ncbi:MAG: hypothetical protein ABSF29_09845 [Tepidisphaeraceae bacterium]|jgi:hypothetical protein
MKRMIKIAAVAGFSAVLGLFSTTRAATVISDIGGSGWTATFSGLSLEADPTQPAGQLDVEKAAVFNPTAANEGLLITFTQTSATATSTIDFTNESITNDTKTNWSGFDFVLLNANGSASFVTSADSPFAPPAGFFTSVSVGSVDGNPTVAYGGGTQGYLATSLWGIGPDGDLIIDANPLGIGTTFTFKEVPVSGPLVPLPAAGYQGLAGLLGLGLVAYGKSLKKLMA